METCPNGEKTLAKSGGQWVKRASENWAFFSQIFNLRPNPTKFGQLFLGNLKPL